MSKSKTNVLSENFEGKEIFQISISKVIMIFGKSTLVIWSII